MNLKIVFNLYIFISVIILSDSTNLKEVMPYYPYPSNLEDYYTQFSLQSKIPVIKKLDYMNLEYFENLKIFINKITDFDNGITQSFPAEDNSLESLISSFGINTLLSIGLEALKIWFPNYKPLIQVAQYSWEYIKDKFDNTNNIELYITQENLSKNKYNKIIKDEIGNYLENIIKNEMSGFDFKNYIYKYLTNGNEWESLYSIFMEENIDSLNFILLGVTGSGKSRLINDILDLKSGIDGPYVNQKYAEPTTMNYQKYNNISKKGIELIDTRGAELTENYNIKIHFQYLSQFFEEEIMRKNNMFIYSFIYLSESNSFSEYDYLINLVKNHYNKIPLKIIFTKSKTMNQTEMLNNTVRKYFKINNNKIYFLQSYNDEKYKENINTFLNDLIEELNEEKLKDIYNYYFSLNVFKSFKKLILYDNIIGILLCQISNEKNIDIFNYMSAKLILDLNTLLFGININIEKIRQKMKNVYYKVYNELKKDIENSNLRDYAPKNFKDKNWFDSFLNYFKTKPDSNDIIAQEISKKINSLIIDIYLKEIKEKLINNPIKIGVYPNFTNIRKNIINNYIQDFSQNKSKSNTKLIFLVVAIIFAIIFGFIICPKCRKCSNFKKPEPDIELSFVDKDFENKN